MPNARTHDLITLVTAGCACGVYFRASAHPDPAIAAVFTSAYLFAGYACAGDLDLASREYYRWGLLRFIWWPYRVLVPHRSWISHGLAMGGVIRAAYLALVTAIVVWASVYLYSRLGPHADPTASTVTVVGAMAAWVQSHPAPAGAALAGFILAGAAHSMADFIYSGVKRRLRVR